MIRRTFTVHHDNEYDLPEGQLLVTFNADTDTVHVAFRPAVWATWSRPFAEDIGARQDDDPALGSRRYGEEGRAYQTHGDDGESHDATTMHVVGLDHVAEGDQPQATENR